MRACIVLALFLAPLVGGCQKSEPYARAYRIADLSETIGGPKALARPGDYVIENDRIRIAILDARVSMGPHTSGASIIDADLQRPDPRYQHGNGNDRLAEVFPTVSLNVEKADGGDGIVEIIADGSDGGGAIICTEGPEESFIKVLDALWTVELWPGGSNYRMRTDYSLEPGSAALHIRTYAIFSDQSGCRDEVTALPVTSSETSLPLLEQSLESGLTIGDFYLQGGSVDVFTPDVGFDEEQYVYDLAATGANTFTDPIKVDFLAGTAEGVSYGLMAAEGALFVPMFTASQTVAIGGGVDGHLRDPKDPSQGYIPNRFNDGEAFYYDRWFAVGSGDVGSVIDALMEARGVATGTVDGFVVEETTGVAISGAHVFAFKAGSDAPWCEWQTDVGDDPHADGSFGGTLPPGDWELLVHQEGRPDSASVPITVKEGQNEHIVLASPQPGAVHYTVVDETGTLVPSKVTFFTDDGPAARDPVLGDGYIAGAPVEVAWSIDGTGEVVLPPGSYHAVASRGIEYELDVSDSFEVNARQSANLELQVVRSVDTAGWISADLHVHSVYSHDSGVSLQDRVTTMAAEGVEFMASTDHDVLTDYGPVIEEMGVERWISSTVGLEVTTIELGHFLGFPLLIDFMADAGGAIDWTGDTPEEVVAGIRDLKDPDAEVDPVVFVGHPRDGILGYFDQYGLNPYLGSEGELVTDPGTLGLFNDLLDPDNFGMDFDAIELLNSKRFELIRTPTQPELDAVGTLTDEELTYDMLERTMAEQDDLAIGTYTLGYGWEGQIDDWFTLLNLGYRTTALGNSDTHGKSSVESGCPRNFVWSDTDNPAFLDEGAIATAVREGRVVASYGPFVRFFSGEEANGPGSTVQGTSVDLTIEVDSPSWFSVDRVELYENGTLIQEWSGDAVDALGLVNLSTAVTVTPEKDSWYVVIAMGDDDLAPVFTPVEIPPIQLQDVVFDALAGVGLDTLLPAAVPVPRTFPIIPFALTNPIWVDVDGDGAITPPGLPDWLVEPPEPVTP